VCSTKIYKHKSNVSRKKDKNNSEKSEKHRKLTANNKKVGIIEQKRKLVKKTCRLPARIVE
jgi:hypothetical protein